MRDIPSSSLPSLCSESDFNLAASSSFSPPCRGAVANNFDNKQINYSLSGVAISAPGADILAIDDVVGVLP